MSSLAVAGVALSLWASEPAWYYTALYPHYDHAAGAGWAVGAQQVRFDNPELNALPVFREAVPVYHAQRKPPPAESGLATWRTLAENFLPGEPDAEIINGNPKPHLPLIVGFGSKRHVTTYGGKIDLDHEEWKRWKAAHTNLLCCWSHIEWDNTVPLTYARAPQIADATRRREVMDFLGKAPRDRYERLKVQRRFYDRMKDLYYGDDDVTGVMFASLYTGHIAAGFGAKMLIVETTNTSGRDAPEYRWNVSPMFCRGAARQFGLPWEWYVAVYMNGWTSKGEWWNNTECVYPWSKDAEIKMNDGYHPGPDFGVSRSLQRRAFYFAYLSGANLVEQEEWSAMFLMWDREKGKTVLSPRGEDFVAYHTFTQRHPDRGVPYTPVAILVPYAQGYSTYGGYPWGTSAYGYTAGDHAIDAVFFTLVPGFDRASALKKGIETNLHNSRYAMMYDAVCPDAPQDPEKLLAALRRYRALVIAGDYPDRGFERMLAQYERGGGRVIRVGGDEVPPPGANAVAKTQSGQLQFPKVAKIFDSLQSEFFPVKVEGDCMYGLNRGKKSCWLWAFNNKGVVKFADVPQRIDPDAAAAISVELRELAGGEVTELLTGEKMTVRNGRFSATIPPGDLRIFEIRSEETIAPQGRSLEKAVD